MERSFRRPSGTTDDLRAPSTMPSTTSVLKSGACKEEVARTRKELLNPYLEFFSENVALRQQQARIDELKNFAQDFELKTPVPKDLVPIIYGRHRTPTPTPGCTRAESPIVRQVTVAPLGELKVLPSLKLDTKVPEEIAARTLVRPCAPAPPTWCTPTP